MGGLTEQSAHAGHQQRWGRSKTDSIRSVCSRHVPPPSDLGETFGVLQTHFLAILDHRLITGQFALPAQSSVSKPGSGVKEDHPAGEARQKIPEIVAAPHVRE